MKNLGKFGFTMVELMLAMGFVSVLLLAIAMTVIQVSDIYERGLTLKEVNQAGQAVSSELQKNITGSVPFELVPCTNLDLVPVSGCNYMNQNTADGKSWAGRLCIGQYSYIWNYGVTIKNAASPVKNVYTTNPGNTIRFVKIIDVNADYCANPLRTVTDNIASELLNVGQHNLAIHSFSIVESSRDSKSGQRLYDISFLLGTNDTSSTSSINYVQTPGLNDASCKPPSSIGSNSTYCSINKFNISIRAGGVNG